MTNPTSAPSPQAALQQARDALTGWMDQPDTPAAYDASMERAIAAVAAIDEALAASQQAVAEPFELAQDAEQLAAWLENQFKRHGEIEDRLAAEMLRDMAKKWTPSALAHQSVSEPPPVPYDLAVKATIALGFLPPGLSIENRAVSEPPAGVAVGEHIAGWTRSAIFQAAKACAAHAFDQPITNSPSQKFWQSHADNLNSIVDAIDSATPTHQAAEPDMRAVCEALGFDPTNHHNAAKCPYCRPALHQAAEPAASDMVMAPREPTEEIELAGEKALLAEFGRASRETWADVCGRVYRAMIAAAAPSAAHEMTPVPEAMEVGEDTKRLDWLIKTETGHLLGETTDLLWSISMTPDEARAAIDAARAQQS